MATCRDIIKKALRRIGVVAAGADPTAAMAEEALGHLIGQYTAWVGMGVFGRMRDKRITSATYTALEQDRISIADENSAAITLPDTITEEWIGGVGGYANDYGFVTGGEVGYVQNVTARPPRDQSCVLVTSLCECTTKIFVYDGSAGRWQEITALTLNDTAPLSIRYEKALVDILAGNLADSYGQDIAPRLQLDIATANSMISHKWDRPRYPAIAEYM